MDCTVIYHPYRSYKWFIPFVISVGVLSFIAVGCCIPNVGGILFWFIIGVLSMFLTRALHNSASIVIFFTREGLQIAGSRRKDDSFFPWNRFSYVYYAKNFKGHLFLVLSPEELSPKEAKRIANRGANSSTICVDLAVVIYMDFLQDTTQLKRLIDDCILY